MANHKGSEGLVKIGVNDVAELVSWAYDETAATIPDTILGDAAATHKTGETSWTGTMEVLWDEADTTGQGAMTIGASVTVEFYPEGDASTDVYKTGTATVTSIGARADNGTMVENSFGLTGNGALADGTVA